MVWRITKTVVQCITLMMSQHRNSEVLLKIMTVLSSVNQRVALVSGAHLGPVAGLPSPASNVATLPPVRGL